MVNKERGLVRRVFIPEVVDDGSVSYAALGMGEVDEDPMLSFFKAFFESDDSEGKSSPPKTEPVHHLPGYRPTGKDPIPENIYGIERLHHTYWGNEIRALGLLFITGDIRFSEIVPSDLYPNPGKYNRTSIDQTNALYMLTASSLYWAEELGEIPTDIAREKAGDLIWTFGYNNYTIRRELEHNPVHPYKGVREILAAYHGSGDAQGEVGEDILDQIRNLRNNAPITVPERLHGWLKNPNLLLKDFDYVWKDGDVPSAWWNLKKDDYLLSADDPRVTRWVFPQEFRRP